MTMRCATRPIPARSIVFLVGVACVVAATGVGHWLVGEARGELRHRLNRLDDEYNQGFDVYYDHQVSLSPLPGRCRLMLGLGTVGLTLLLFGMPRSARPVGGNEPSDREPESIRRAGTITMWGGAACLIAATALGVNLSGDAQSDIGVPWLRLDLMFSDDDVANDTYVRQARSWFFGAATLTWVALGLGAVPFVRGLRSQVASKVKPTREATGGSGR